MSTARKRFYQNASVVSTSNGGQPTFELTLDHKKLKTPLGNVLKINNELLANAVAEEWNAQKELIMLSQMHLTGLCNICIDNPTGASKEDLVEDVLNFLETDTVFFFGDGVRFPSFSWNNLRRRVMFCLS